MADEVDIKADTGNEMADALASLEAKEKELEALETKPEVKPEPAKETVETKEPVVAVEEPHVEKEIDEHGEKSKEGRQVKRLRREIADLKSDIRSLKDTVLTSRPEVVEDDPEPDLSEMPTADEVRAHSQWTMRQVRKETASQDKKIKTETDNKVKYGKEYLQMVDDYVDQEDEPDLFALLTDNKDLTFNRKLSDDPKKDFLTNFRNAQTFLQGKSPKKPVHTKVPMGTNTGNISKPTAEIVNVDTSGWSQEEQQVAKLFTPDELRQMKAEKRL